MSWFETVTDVAGQQETVRRRAYGVIETENGQFVRIQFRPWPKFISLLEIRLLGMRVHKQKKKDRCLLFFNQPIFHRNYLVIPYVLSFAGTSYATSRKAQHVLDQVAFIKQSDAILCEATNAKLSDRAMSRLGWEAHVPGSKRRHFIKRFYGDYPANATIERFPGLEERLLNVKPHNIPETDQV